MLLKSDSGRLIYLFSEGLATEVTMISIGGIMMGFCGGLLAAFVGFILAATGMITDVAAADAWRYGAAIFAVPWLALMARDIITADERVDARRLAKEWISLNRHLPSMAGGISQRVAIAIATNALLRDSDVGADAKSMKP